MKIERHTDSKTGGWGKMEWNSERERYSSELRDGWRKALRERYPSGRDTQTDQRLIWDTDLAAQALVLMLNESMRFWWKLWGPHRGIIPQDKTQGARCDYVLLKALICHSHVEFSLILIGPCGFDAPHNTTFYLQVKKKREKNIEPHDLKKGKEHNLFIIS